MKMTTHTTIHLGDVPAENKVVMQHDGGGVNLWVGGVVITADNALCFHELAKLAQLAANMQERCDEGKAQPHAFVMSADVERSLRAAGISPVRDRCSKCGKDRADETHTAVVDEEHA